jgi:hypothetical protein
MMNATDQQLPRKPPFWTRKIGCLPIWALIIAAIIALYTVSVVIRPVPRGPLKWTTTHTFVGKGDTKTAVFSVLGEWKLTWTCDPTSASYGMYNLWLDTDDANGTVLDKSTVNTICEASNTHAETGVQQQDGNVYLDIGSGGSWVIAIQELE